MLLNKAMFILWQTDQQVVPSGLNWTSVANCVGSQNTKFPTKYMKVTKKTFFHMCMTFDTAKRSSSRLISLNPHYQCNHKHEHKGRVWANEDSHKINIITRIRISKHCIFLMVMLYIYDYIVSSEDMLP